jgi:hypothetical protein
MKKNILLITLFCLTIQNIYSQVNTLKENIFFAIGKTELTKAHKMKLDSIVLVIKASQTYNVDVKGYTCNIGSLSLNKIVSKFRALNVYNYLVDKGVNKKNIVYGGFATASPLGDNTTAEGRSKNRRTEISVLFKLMDEVVQNAEGTQNANATNSRTNSTGNTTNASNNSNAPAFSGKITELGPELSNGNFQNEGKKIIKSTNCVLIEVPEYCFSTNSKEAFEFEFKDYTKNYDIIKKNIQTRSGKETLLMLGAYSLNFSQGNEEITMNTNNPVKVFIPGEYDPEIRLYSNHKNWTLDTINSLSYDESKKAYVVSTKFLGQMFGLLKPMPITQKQVLVKLVGVKPDQIKPYVIVDKCYIASGKHVKGKLFSFPIPSDKSSFSVRGYYIDYSNKQPEYFYLSEDIKALEPKSTKVKSIENKEYMRICSPAKFEFKKTQMDKGSLCEPPCAQ